MDYLLDAIDALTLPRKTRITVASANGIECVSEHEGDSLLAQLRDSIAGGIMSHAGGSSDPAERLPINAGAIHLYEQIERRIGEWYVDAFHKPVGLLPEADLREWHRDLLLQRSRVLSTDVGAQESFDALEVEVTRVVTSWVRRITDFYDPPKRLEITTIVEVPVVDPKSGERLYRRDGELRTRLSTRPAPCPLCQQPSAFDPTTGDSITALVIEYRTSDAEAALRTAVAVCRSCEARWEGDHDIRALRLAIDEREGAAA
jgi:hypothetical protein